MSYLGTELFFFFFKDFQDHLVIFPLGKGFPCDENYKPPKVVCHLQPVGPFKLSIYILN